MSVISRRLIWFGIAMLAAPLLAIPGTVPTPAAAATTFVVDTTVDLISLDDCTAAPGDCSLRGAVSAANAAPGPDTIHFNLPSGDCPGGVCRIALAFGSIEITEQVDLDATTQPQNGSPRANVCATATDPSHMRVEVVMDAGTSRTALSINHAAGATKVRGFALGANTDSAGAAISIQNGSNHHIACNHLSLNGAGTDSLGTGDFIAGVYLTYLAQAVTVGTDGDGVDDIAERNVFGPDSLSTIYVDATVGHVIAGNYFGFTADGATRLGADYLTIRDNADGVLVGTNEDGVSDELERNFFTGGTNIQVASTLYDPDDVAIVGNTFGISPTGARANSNIGIAATGLPAATTGFEIRGNTFAWAESGIDVDASGASVLISENTFGGDDNGTPYGSIVAIRASGSGSYVISDNLFRNSDLAAVILEDTAVLGAGSRDNCLVGNFFGLSNTAAVEIAFEHNWWGDITGPSVIGPGTGDPVSTRVDYEPWLTAPAEQCNTAPAISDANFTVSEDAAVGTVVGTVSATDDGDEVAYGIKSGNVGGGFAIDSVTGELSVAKALDYETIPAYVLSVTASDPFLSDTASVVIVVADVDEPEPAPTFKDVPATHTFYHDIEWLAATAITLGCNPPVNDMFCPDASVTRGQMAAFLHRALGDTQLPGPPVEFVDDDGSVFEADIEWLGAVGVTKGCNPPVNDRFCPEQSVTRGQMAAFLVRALDLPAGVGVDFVDDDASIFEDDIEALAAAGITRGCNPPDNDMFCPDDPVKRDQMAAFLHRALTMGG